MWYIFKTYRYSGICPTSYVLLPLFVKAARYCRCSFLKLHVKSPEEKLHEIGNGDRVPIIQGYGLTETCAGASFTELDDTSVGRVGPPVPHCYIKVDVKSIP